MRIRNIDNSIKLLVVIVFICALANAANITQYYMSQQGRNHTFFGDYRYVWREMVFAVRGITPERAWEEGIVFPETGEYPERTATFPFVRLIGNLAIPGYMSYEFALKYSILLFLVVISTAAFSVLPHLEKYNISGSLPLLFLIFMSPLYWKEALLLLNNTVFDSFCIAIVFFGLKKDSYFGGFLMALAMLKPQVAALFFILLLYLKWYKTIASTAFTLVISWIMYAMITNLGVQESFFQLLPCFSGRTVTETDFFWYGIFDVVRRMGGTSGIAVVLSALLGIALCILLLHKLNNTVYSDDMIVLFSVPAILSTVWLYKTVADFIILIFPMLLVFPLMRISDSLLSRKRSTVISILLLLSMSIKPFSGIFRRILGYEWLLGVSLDAWFRTICFLVAMYILIKTGNTTGALNTAADTDNGGGICSTQ